MANRCTKSGMKGYWCAFAPQVDTSGAPTSFRPLRKRMSGGRMSSSSTGVSGAASTSTLSGPAAAAAMAAAAATIGAKSSNGDRRISSLKGRTGGAARGGGSDAGADAEGLMTSLEIAAEQVRGSCCLAPAPGIRERLRARCHGADC